MAGKTVLIVEDEPLLREILADELRAAGFLCLEASGGKEAARILDTESVGLVATDYYMPEGDGLFVLEHVKARGLGCPVVLMSGNIDLDEKALRDWGAPRLLRKPFDPQELADLVAKLLTP